jgi:hypothetical protein
MVSTMPDTPVTPAWFHVELVPRQVVYYWWSLVSAALSYAACRPVTSTWTAPYGLRSRAVHRDPRNPVDAANGSKRAIEAGLKALSAIYLR